MNELNKPTALSERNGERDSLRAQILATEHWSLLATRSMTWSEIFNRATMFITVLSAAAVAIALVAQATDFGPDARAFALVVLPVVLLVGLTTFFRLGEANTHDITLVIGMNRLRHAYVELAPELEPYFTTAHHDDTPPSCRHMERATATPSAACWEGRQPWSPSSTSSSPE